MEKSVAYLEKRIGESVEAELWDDITENHIELWRSGWSPMIEEAKKKIPRERWPQDLHWDWEKKTDWSRKYLSLRRFALTCETALQGLMLVNLTKLTGRLPARKERISLTSNSYRRPHGIDPI